MRVIDSRVGTYIHKLAEGATFQLNGVYWLVSDYVDDNDNTLCVRLESGRAEFIPMDLIVVPVTAEVHIL